MKDISHQIMDRFQAALNANGMTEEELTQKALSPPLGWVFDEITQCWLDPKIILFPMAQQVQSYNEIMEALC